VKQKRIAAIILLLFYIAAFCASGVTASCTIKNATMTTEVSHFASLYSLSSAAVLVLPVLILLLFLALVSYLKKQPNIGFLFTVVSLVLYALFLFFYCREDRNSAIYTTLNDMFVEAGMKVKKRDFHIVARPQFMCYVTLALGTLTALCSVPDFSTANTRYHLKRELEPYAYIAPHVLLFTIFALLPIIYGIYTSFTKWDLYNNPVFTGLSNFHSLLIDANNTYYAQLRLGLSNTVKFVILTVPLCIIVPLGLAMSLRHVKVFNKLLQTVFYVPALLSSTTVMLSWDYFFQSSYGFANNFLGFTCNWFSPPYSWAMLVIITVWWCSGTNMVIFQSSLASIPAEQYEAAAIDGADNVQKFRYITLPNMSYTLMYTMVTSITAQFGVYAQPSILMGYSYNGANAVLMMYIKDTAFSQGVAGMASAMALILGCIIMVVSFIQIRMMLRNNKG